MKIWISKDKFFIYFPPNPQKKLKQNVYCAQPYRKEYLGKWFFKKICTPGPYNRRTPHPHYLLCEIIFLTAVNILMAEFLGNPIYIEGE